MSYALLKIEVYTGIFIYRYGSVTIQSIYLLSTEMNFETTLYSH